MNLFFPEPILQNTPFDKKYGVIIINVGAPEVLDIKEIKRYLKYFLSDKRVIESPSWRWQIILRFIVLNRRPKRSLQKYQRIWKNNDLSPLSLNSMALIEKIQSQFNHNKQNVVIKMAMSYSKPLISEALFELKQEKITHLVILPLFPQYSGTTIGASLDQVWRFLLKTRYQPEIATINGFYDHPLYINAVAKHINNFWSKNGRSKKLLFSFHGIPSEYIEKGDPYFVQCMKSVELISQKLNLTEKDYLISFQSRFGKIRWLQPFTQKLLVELPQQGIDSIDVFSPSFIVDCLETLEEINISGKKIFLTAGGKSFNYIPCLNTEDFWIQALSSIINEKIITHSDHTIHNDANLAYQQQN